MLKARFPIWTIPIALLATCLLGFGLMIPWLGFYWDDWPAIWFLHFFGPSSFKEVFAIDRPLLSWLFRVVVSHWMSAQALMSLVTTMSGFVTSP